LLPPPVTLGLLLGSGDAAAFGVLLLLTANVICVNLAGVATVLLQGVRPRTWWQVEQALGERVDRREYLADRCRRWQPKNAESPARSGVLSLLFQIRVVGDLDAFLLSFAGLLR
jgi:hypothetical protein